MKELNVIKKVIPILDSIDYKRYSNNQANNYLEYASGRWTDERILIAPILFPKFLKKILNFELGKTIGTQENFLETGDFPDYIPVDIHTHSFLFDCKGMDTLNLSKWYKQIKRYLESLGLKYGILSNMRDLDVYTTYSTEEVEKFNFSFIELYKEFKENPDNILKSENTRRFFQFIEKFQYSELTFEQKFNKVMAAKNWNGNETINIDLLTRSLYYIVEQTYDDIQLRRDELYSIKEYDSNRAIKIAQEIEIIASEVQQGRPIKTATLETFEEIFDSPSRGVLSKAFSLFFYRVSYYTMTRILLIRAWEDIGFIDQSLYNGGLARLYKDFNKQIRRVLKYAYNLAAERYKWLFGIENNYTWYEPSEETLVNILYELSNFNLGKINQDILGTIYEEYVNKVDKKKKGQYYTPREIVKFIWDRVGFKNDIDFFEYSKGKREQRLIFDPASGSGGFLVEAIRRIKENGKINYDDFDDVLDLRTVILTRIFGSEISPFPYYITEVNLLIQLSSIIKRMMDLEKKFIGRGTPALGVIPIDSLSLFNPDKPILEDRYIFDNRRNILTLEKQKQSIFNKIKYDFDKNFYYCCSNPPYVGERGNKDLFRTTLSNLPYWKEFYQGKMDYLYFFIFLGLSKLKDFGKLGFITTSYWPTADGASKLRKYILDNTRIKEFIFFEDIKIFEYARGQHNMVFVLEKCQKKENREDIENNKIKIVEVLARHQDVPGDTTKDKLKFITYHINEHINKDEWEDKYIKVFWSGIKQGELSKDGGVWNIKASSSTDSLLNHMNEIGNPLKDIADINSGADITVSKLTSSNIELLPYQTVQQFGLKVGDGIYVLKESEMQELNLNDSEKQIVKPFIKNSEISKYIINTSNRKYLIYLNWDSKLNDYPNIKRHLEKFRPIMEAQLEQYEESYPWWALHRPRNQKIFEGTKIVNPQHSTEPSFAFSNGPLYASRDVYYIKLNDEIKEDIFYLLGILNSKLNKIWLNYRGKKKGESYELKTTPLSKVPIRRINFNNTKDLQLYDTVVKKVKEIINVMNKLSNYTKFFESSNLTRLEFDTLPEINPLAVIEFLMKNNLLSLRIHPEIKIINYYKLEESQFILNKIGSISSTLEEMQLKIYDKGKKTIYINSKESILKFVAIILNNYLGKTWNSIKERNIIPFKLEEYEEKKQKIIQEVGEIRKQIYELQEKIDFTISELYGVSKDIIDKEFI